MGKNDSWPLMIKKSSVNQIIMVFMNGKKESHMLWILSGITCSVK